MLLCYNFHDLFRNTNKWCNIYFFSILEPLGWTLGEVGWRDLITIINFDLGDKAIHTLLSTFVISWF